MPYLSEQMLRLSRKVIEGYEGESSALLKAATELTGYVFGRNARCFL